VPVKAKGGGGIRRWQPLEAQLTWKDHQDAYQRRGR